MSSSSSHTNDGLSFTAEFFTEFIPSAGSGREGFDISVDNEEPIGSDRIKGLMRAAALETLGLKRQIVDSVFGTQSSPSPWHWIAFDHESQWKVDKEPFGSRHRIQIDPERHSAMKGALAYAETAWAPEWRFEVLPRTRISEADRELHELVLIASALSVKHMGLWRRRGYGWMGVRYDGEPLTAQQSARLLQEQGE